VNRTIVKIISTVVLTVVGILYTSMMYQFARAIGGGGQYGSPFFRYLVVGPEGVCLPIWTILFALLPWTRVPKVALTVVCAAIIPALWVILVLNLEGVQDDIIKEIWRRARPVVYIFSAMFFLPSLIGLLTGLRGAIGFFKAMNSTKAD
jgi:hypothetical protein